MTDKGMFASLASLKGNVLCAIDTESTGPDSNYHEPIQIAIVPLDYNIEPAHDPFVQYIRPKYPERADKTTMKVHGIDLNDLMENAPPLDDVLRMLLDWSAGVPRGVGRSLIPLAHNYYHDYKVLTRMMGDEFYHSVFHPHPRDTMAMGALLNDIYAWRGESFLFNSLGLKEMSLKFNLINDNAHEAYSDCLHVAKLYQALLQCF